MVRPKRFAGLTTLSALRLAQLFLRLRPIGLALRALLCEEGNSMISETATVSSSPAA